MSCTARSMTTPTFDMRGGNGPTRVMAIERMSSLADRVLDRLDRRIEALDVADHQRDAGPVRRRDDGAALLDRRRDRLLDHDMHAALDAGDREVAMKMRGRGDGHGVDAARPAAPRRPHSRDSRARRRRIRAACGRDRRCRTSFTPGRSARTRAWLLPMTPTPTTPMRSRPSALSFADCTISTQRPQLPKINPRPSP